MWILPLLIPGTHPAYAKLGNRNLISTIFFLKNYEKWVFLPFIIEINGLEFSLSIQSKESEDKNLKI